MSTTTDRVHFARIRLRRHATACTCANGDAAAGLEAIFHAGLLGTVWRGDRTRSIPHRGTRAFHGRFHESMQDATGTSALACGVGTG